MGQTNQVINETLSQTVFTSIPDLSIKPQLVVILMDILQRYNSQEKYQADGIHIIRFSFEKYQGPQSWYH